MSRALALEGVTLAYRGAAALEDVTLRVEEGETLALLGPSGSGKSSVLRLLLGLVAPVQGRVELWGEVASRAGEVVVPPEARGLAMVFQDLALWPHLTVGGNLDFVLRGQGIDPSGREARIGDILARVGLSARTDRFPGELSGGERQRVAIARALAARPRAVLLDEPLASVDAALRRELLAVFRDLFDEHRSTVVYVTHDLREAAALADRAAVLEAGRVVQQGTVDELRARPAAGFAAALVAELEAPPLVRRR